MNESSPPSPSSAQLFPPLLKAGLCTAAAAYLAAWGTHLYIGTAALRGFFGDGALAFLIHLSHSYMFNRPGHLVHLFAVGFPRDFQLLLNALGLQVALWLSLRDPETFKYIFVFWQFALPGFLYLALFAALWRKGYAAWIIFPLMSWAILSVPVDWAATNSTRWAVPIFWMHFMLVILSGPKLRTGPAAAALFLGAAMLGGIYESVVLHCALCIGLGVLLWWRQGNRIPFFYALTALPGACRAFLTYTDTGHDAPNGFHSLILPHAFHYHPYFFLMTLTLALVAILGTGKISARYAFIPLLLILWPAARTLIDAIPNPWPLMEMRFDYVFLSLALMGWAGLLRVAGGTPMTFAPSAALVTLASGTILWILQVQGTFWWQDCRAPFAAQMQTTTLGIDENYRSLFADDRPAITLPYRMCVWDWAEPWTSLLLADHGRVESWPILTFWQDFAFVKKDGAVYLHTNNWTLNSPSMQESGEDMPLKTPLYDLTPLYKKLGDGPLAARLHCMPPEKANSYWRPTLMSMDDAKRTEMFVCPRSP